MKAAAQTTKTTAPTLETASMTRDRPMAMTTMASMLSIGIWNGPRTRRRMMSLTSSSPVARSDQAWMVHSMPTTMRTAMPR